MEEEEEKKEETKKEEEEEKTHRAPLSYLAISFSF